MKITKDIKDLRREIVEQPRIEWISNNGNYNPSCIQCDPTELAIYILNKLNEQMQSM